MASTPRPAIAIHVASSLEYCQQAVAVRWEDLLFLLVKHNKRNNNNRELIGRRNIINNVPDAPRVSYMLAKTLRGN